MSPWIPALVANRFFTSSADDYGMTTSWAELFDRSATTDGTVALETIREELERRREREPEPQHREDTDA
ncbi:hypothetical protein OB955_22750 [Halobacteria archaeon AArc-m2/3/4]|uniref:Uncharacterized protein n=1 Tax=Natronoglomus mannanivorans TaxID=2979990 RepID=A0AAP2Z525_9EURY|nr:hypothetical protein [Halobacteria archaeon AArc-xg1-1]MCU4975510.1 hypothetical protein [Halobacteria archaeon AArc-m2/3/4]